MQAREWCRPPAAAGLPFYLFLHNDRCMDYAGVAALLLLVIGLALLIAEVFIPSGGVIMITAITCLAGSVWFAWSAWWESYRTFWWAYILSLLLLVPLALAGAFYIFPRTSWGRRVLLEGPSLTEVTGYAREEEELTGLIGRRGKTITMLNPGGLVLVEGKRYHAESQGMLLDPGEEVEVIARKANRIVVRVPRTPSATEAAVEPEEHASEADRVSPDVPDRERRPLDFDFPES